MVVTIILAALASTGLFAFVEFLIKRSDDKRDNYDAVIERLEKIEKRLDTNEKDSLRTQMLIMMNHYPEDHIEIMKLAERYFSVLHGDWYMTSIFNKWLEKNSIGKPEWFNPED